LAAHDLDSEDNQVLINAHPNPQRLLDVTKKMHHRFILTQDNFLVMVQHRYLLRG
jgi:hypothetical protein